MSESYKRDDRQETRLEDQEQIINQYLEALLSEVPEYGAVETEVRTDITDVVTVIAVPEIAPDEAQQQVIAPQLEALDDDLDGLEERPAPDWAQDRFQCLVMRVGDLTLAIPLLALDNIIKWDTDPTPMPFQPDWHIGVLQNRDHKVVVVDTLKLLIPNQIRDDVVTREQGSHILIIGDHRFGLACDSLAKPLMLNKDDVRWSIQHPDRPWMAGTIKEKLTVLLDIDAILAMIRHE